MYESKIVVPSLGESVVEATVARWLKKEGDRVEPGEPLVELETDKVNLEVGAEKSGVLSRIQRKEGEDVKIGDELGVISDASESEAQPAPAKNASLENVSSEKAAPAKAPEPKEPSAKPADKAKATPSARRLAQEQNIDLNQITGSGSGNQITLQDVQSFVDRQQQQQTKIGTSTPSPAAEPPPVPKPQRQPADSEIATENRREERMRLTRRRRTIAKRLVEAQHNAAMLTTYNEVDLGPVMDLRKRHKESFQKKHGVGLGIVSFFVKASVAALKDFPQINSELLEDELLMKYYYDIGIAIGAEEGLVVPVLRDADRLTFAQIEQGIRGFVDKSSQGTLSLEDLRGGTFTITNGGVYGSLMSTPILNPPQVAILGLHKIEERPVAVNGQIAIRPMMYVALSYDHRVVDGRESVQFLARIKAFIEDPSSMLLEI
jgi:2-oxoglutarate dehydrogenase E2 component (dihydrolipoamide succinyltransferase)